MLISPAMQQKQYPILICSECDNMIPTTMTIIRQTKIV